MVILNLCVTSFLFWVSKTQPNQWTKRMASTRLAFTFVCKFRNTILVKSFHRCRWLDRTKNHQRGPRGLPLSRIFMVLGGIKAAFVPSLSPGPWRARRLNSADVDSCVWLVSTLTYIACAVLFMVWIPSRLGG